MNIHGRLHSRVFVCVALAVAAVTAFGQEPPAVSTFRMRSDSGAALLFIGTQHSNDPADPQMRAIAGLITRERPDVVLVEGGQWPVVDPPEAAIALGELAFAANVARSAGLRVDDADPSLESEIDEVVVRHGADNARLFYALRMVPQFARERRVGIGPEFAMSRWITSRPMQRIPESDRLSTLDDLEALCRHLLPGSPRLRTRDLLQGGCWQTWGSSRWEGSFLEQVRRTSSAYRDAFILRRVIAEMRAGRRVVVVAGLAHLDAMRGSLPDALAAREAN